MHVRVWLVCCEFTNFRERIPVCASAFFWFALEIPSGRLDAGGSAVQGPIYSGEAIGWVYGEWAAAIVLGGTFKELGSASNQMKLEAISCRIAISKSMCLMFIYHSYCNVVLTFLFSSSHIIVFHLIFSSTPIRAIPIEARLFATSYLI